MFLVLFYLFNWGLFTLIHLLLTGRRKQALFFIVRSILLIFVFLLHGDGKQIPFIHSEILPYVREFESLYGKKTENISITFTSFFGSSVVGICQSYSKNGGWYRDKVIKLDRDYWNESSKAAKEILVFHELGHCELERDHDDEFLTTNEDGIPVLMSKSIMNSYIINETKYIENRTYYIIELFNKNK